MDLVDLVIAVVALWVVLVAIFGCCGVSRLS